MTRFPPFWLCGRIAVGPAIGLVPFVLGLAWAGEPPEQTVLLTLQRGLRHREQCVQSVQGLLLHRIYRSDQQTRRFSRARGEEVVLPERSFFQVRFAADDGRWMSEAVALVGGPSPWNVPSSESLAAPLAQDSGQTARARQLLYVFEDGQRHVEYDPRAGIGRVNTQAQWLPLARRLPLCEFLLLGPSAFASWADQLIIEETRTPSPTVEDRVRGTKAAVLRAVRSWPEYEGECETKGVRCYRVLLCAEGEGKVTGRVRLWIAPDYGYAVIRSESTTLSGPGDGVCVVHEGLAFSECSPGVWFPGRTVVQVFRYPPTTESPWAQTEEITFQELQANKPIDDSTFSFSFPVGTKIYDKVGGGDIRIEGGVSSREITEFDTTPRPAPDATLSKGPPP